MNKITIDIKATFVYNDKKLIDNKGAYMLGWEEVENFDLYNLIWVMPT